MVIDTAVQSSLDSILDSTLDDLKDLPEFLVFPPGAHKVTIKWESKEVNKHPAMELKMKVLETLELSEPTDKPLDPGTESSVLFMLDNEMGVGKFKEAMKPLQLHLGTPTNRATVEGSNGLEVVVVTGIRFNKDKTKSYTDLINLQVV